MSSSAINAARAAAAAAPEVEVFRITPTSGKCYEHAEYTRKEGRYPNPERYYFRGQPRYVGKHTGDKRSGFGNGGEYFSFFDNNGTKNRVNYSYEGHTCFREVPCRDDKTLRNVLDKYGIQGEAGTGPANIIRGFAGYTALPNGKGPAGAGAGAGKGGSRRRTFKRVRRNRRKTSRKY